VALLVHGLFNAAIAKEDMGGGFTFHHPHDHGEGPGAAYWCVAGCWLIDLFVCW
jgi:hypothetical protein